MKQRIKNELLALAATNVIKKGFLVVSVLLLGVAIGYLYANKECEPCPIGFASLEDMSFLVSELRDCKGYY